MSHRGRATKQIKHDLVKDIAEIPEIVAFITKHFEETGLQKVLPYSEEKVMKSIASLAISGGGYLFYSYADSKNFQDKPLRDKIVGVLILGEESPWFSDQSYFVNVGYYVIPKYRKLGVSQSLLDLAKAWSKSLRKPLILDYRNMDEEFLSKITKYGKINGFKALGVSQVYS
jgi:hypothetical protein